VVAAEDTRRTRALLSAAGVPAAGRLVALHAHNEAEVAARLAKRLAGGDRVAYVTDAGMPGISDPGERLVRAALDAGAGIEVVPGPSAALAALVVSGLPTGRFAFEGFLPRKPASARVARLRALAAEDRTVVIYESPRRLLATLSDLAGTCGPDRPVAVARELTKVFETVWRGTLGEAIAGPGGPEPRGEQVIVLGPRGQEADVPADVDVEAALTAELDSGASVRDAASAVAGRLAISRRRAYELATRLRAQ
jgi:16S rRNA (cytidine1402-2'-O)-methyltransferase